MISLETARQLLDFAGGTSTHRARIDVVRAKAQLEGAVALHNILEERRVAYLADEVGMGKTYVALGTFALFRHFNPQFRLLVIAPKENIQRKWIKELHNFARNNVRFADLRVRSIHGTPARSAVHCENLYELARETSLDPDRDFFVRLTSFGLGLSEDAEGWKRKRDALRTLLPWIDDELFDLRSKARFKENYARAVGCVLPVFDLVIIDEGHNLKHGLTRNAAMRNRLVALTLGREIEERNSRPSLRHYGPRAKRVLFLSATPVEDDYRQIWNQFDVVGFGDAAPVLNDPAASDEEKRRELETLMIRRVASIQSADRVLTKNLYRRDWRSGGVASHDDPLPPADERQRLLVALVQKKVSELLSHERFTHSFQIGMLASFESFLQTARVAPDGESPGTFDDAEQTQDDLERQGVDVHQVNRLARAYRKEFREPMPHPKMDAVVLRLRDAFDTGRKALVFVRRVASVTEIQAKLDREYDRWIFGRLRSELNRGLQPRLEKIIERYEAERTTSRPSSRRPDFNPVQDESEEASVLPTDTGGSNTFFAWYFRGRGPEKVLSGAALNERFQQPQYALSSFFDDNYLSALLQVRPGDVQDALSQYLGIGRGSLQSELERRAGLVLKADQKQRRHLALFRAFQHGGLSVIAESKGRLRDEGAMILHQRFPRAATGGRPVPLGDWLERSTFFTELRDREPLFRELWVPAHEDALGVEQRFARRELRRQLLSSMFRLGHAFIDLYILIVNRLGRLDRAGGGDDLENRVLASELLDLLERQRGSSTFRAYHELSQAAEHFDLILDCNAPNLWQKPVDEVARTIGNLLAEQQPVGGMFGEVSKRVVAQFRMPGYPLLLVTTDLLQEGEDLHLFCSDVYHYGISWMPSSMEQRIGRIDRVRSHTERRLTRAEPPPTGDELLQVYLPHLRETVEVFQVNRVLERMERFMRLMHENLGTNDERHDPKINIVEALQRGAPRTAPSTVEPLCSAFPVQKHWVRGSRRPLAVSPKVQKEILRRFSEIQLRLQEVLGVTWDKHSPRASRIGVIALGPRKQGFTLFLHTVEGLPNIRCVSPIGSIDPSVDSDSIARATRDFRVRIGAVFDPRFHQYKLTAEADVLLGDPRADVERACWLVKTVGEEADRLEAVLLQIDPEIASFTESLEREITFER